MNSRFFILLIAAIFVASAPAAEARFFGNLPETVPADQAQQSRDLANRSLTAISQLYAGLARYEATNDPQSINGLIAESASVFKELSARYRELADKTGAVKVTPDEAAKKWPTVQDILRSYDQKLAEFSSLAAVVGKMADEEARLSGRLSKILRSSIPMKQPAVSRPQNQESAVAPVVCGSYP